MFGQESGAAISKAANTLGTGVAQVGSYFTDAQNLAAQSDREAKAAAKEAEREQKAAFKDAQDIQTQKEISGGYLDLAMRDMVHTQKANAAFKDADPNNYPAVAHEFVASLGDEHDEYMQQFSTPKSQAFGERQWGQHIGHVLNRMTADGAAAAGDALHQNFRLGVNAAAEAAAQDPTSVGPKIAVFDDYVNSLVGSSAVDPKQAAAARTNMLQTGHEAIAGRAAEARINADPSQAPAIIKEYADKGWLTPGAQERLQAHATIQAHAVTQDQTAAVAQGVQRTNERSLTAAAGHLGSLSNQEGAFTPNPALATKIVSDPNMKDADKAPLLQANQRLLDHGDVAKSDLNAMLPFVNQLAKGERPQIGDIMAHVGTDITLADAQFLTMGINPASANARQDFSALNVALSDARMQISPSDPGGRPNPAAENAYGRFVDWFMPQIRSGVAAGKSIDQMTNPSSPDYLLKDNKVQQFAPNHQDAVATQFGPRNNWKADAPPGGDVRFNWAAHPQTVEEANKVTWGQHPTNMAGVQALGGWISEASKVLPAGYSVVVTSTTDHSKNVHGGGESQHTSGSAVDIQIQDANGQPIRNRGVDSTGLYRKLADEVRKVYQAAEPGRDYLAWGGNFTTEAHGGQKDLMHFDLGGNRGDGTWDKPQRPTLDNIYSGRIKGVSAARQATATPVEAPPMRQREPVVPVQPEPAEDDG